MDMGISCRKSAFFPGAHRVGAAISGPQNCGHEFYGHEDFSDLGSSQGQKSSFFFFSV